MTSVIVPCWNALALTRVSLSRLALWSGESCELIAIDNGSSDGTGAWLKSFARRARGLAAVRVIRNKKNVGYPAAMNQGIEAARGRFLVFGNNDAAATPRWLEGMRAAFRSRPGVGGVAPCSNFPGSVRPGKPWTVRGLYDGVEELDVFAAAPRGLPVPAFHPAKGFVPGFWFYTSRAVLARVGGFDERFAPGGFEDWDLQWRMRRAGLSLGFADRVYVHHVWFGASRANGLRMSAAYGAKRRARFDEKHPDAAGRTMDVRSFPALLRR